MKCLIIVPAFNEATVLQQVLLSIKKNVPSFSILVVNDGSSDNTSDIASKVKKVRVANHPINRGLGAAINTGLSFAKKNNFDLAVTIDADGQHDPKDIKKLIKPIINNQADIVIGSRIISTLGQIPLDRIIIIKASNFLTWLLYGETTTDSLSGFRAFSKKAIKSIHLKTDRMEVSNELFSEINRLKLKVKEVPIRVIYTNYSRSKGQKNTNAISIIFKLMLRLFR